MLTNYVLIMQFLLVDLRCHGDSAKIKKRGPHTVASAARDVLKLVCFFYLLCGTLFSFLIIHIYILLEIIENIFSMADLFF